VVGGDIDVLQLRARLVDDHGVTAQPGQRGVSRYVLALPEDLVEGTVLLDDEHDVPDGTGTQSRDRRQRIAPVVGQLALPIGVGHDLARVIGQSGRIGDVDHLEQALHDVARMRAAGRGHEVAPAVGAGADSLGTAHEQSLAVARDSHQRAEPAGRNVAGQIPPLQIDHGNRVQPRAGHVERPFVGAQGDREGQHAAQRFQPRHEQLDLIHDRVALYVDDRDRVVCGVGHIYEPRARDHGAGAGAADGVHIAAPLADQVAGLDLGLDPAGLQFDLEDRHGVGMIRRSEPRDLLPLGDDAFLGFPRGHAIRGKRQPGRRSRLRRHVGQQRILEHADVGDPAVLRIRRQADAERVAPHAHRPDHAASVQIDHDHAVVELVNAIQHTPVGTEEEIAQEAVLVAVAIDVDPIHIGAALQVVHHDLPMIGAAEIELFGVGRKRAAHVRPVLQPFRRLLTEGREAIDRLWLGSRDDLDGPARQQDRGRLIGADRHSPAI